MDTNGGCKKSIAIINYPIDIFITVQNVPKQALCGINQLFSPLYNSIRSNEGGKKRNDKLIPKYVLHEML